MAEKKPEKLLVRDEFGTLTTQEKNPCSKYKKEYINVVRNLKSLGFSDEDVAFTLGVHHSTVIDWTKKYPDFETAIKSGRQEALSMLVSKGLDVALGYNYVEANEKYDSEGNMVAKSVFQKHKPADSQLIMFFLANLTGGKAKKPDSFGDKSADVPEVNINLLSNMENEHIDNFAAGLKRLRKQIDSRVQEVENVKQSGLDYSGEFPENDSD